jgi:hypothetical protein
MEFRNLTPFDALAYEGIDTQDREYHVVALAVGYRLAPIASEQQAQAAQRQDPWQPTHEVVLLDQAPHTARLVLADTHWGDPTRTSLQQESDLVPYKPRCDVTVLGNAYSIQPAREFSTRLRVDQSGKTLIDKSLTVTGARHFERGGAVVTAMLRLLDDATVYRLTRPEPATCVPLQYELAFGGNCQVFKPAAQPSASRADATSRVSAEADGASEPPEPPAPEALINEACLRNPVGAGWIVPGYLGALAKSPGGLPERLPAPQISLGSPLSGMSLGKLHKPKQLASSQAMAQVRYAHEVAGYSVLGKSWAPRLALAGTADQAWLDNRAPALPKDFDFSFWNGAPADQQIPFPDLLAPSGLRILSEGLNPQGRFLRVQLPAHRASALMRTHDGLVLPLPMQVDLIELDNRDPEQLRLRLIFRTAVLKTMDLRVLEARFETDPAKPLFTLAPSGDYEKPELSAMQRTLQQEQAEALHG